CNVECDTKKPSAQLRSVRVVLIEFAMDDDEHFLECVFELRFGYAHALERTPNERRVRVVNRGRFVTALGQRALRRVDPGRDRRTRPAFAYLGDETGARALRCSLRGAGNQFHRSELGQRSWFSRARPILHGARAPVTKPLAGQFGPAGFGIPT